MVKNFIRNHIFIIMLTISIGVWLSIMLIQAYQAGGMQIKIEIDNPYYCDNGWYDDEGNTYDISNVAFSKDELLNEYTFHYKIPTDIELGDNYAICFFSRGVNLKAYMSSTEDSVYYEDDEFENTLFYEFSQNGAGLAGHDIGLVAQIVPIYWTDLGNEVTFVVTPTEVSAFIIDVRIQETSKFIYGTVRSRMFKLVSSFFIAFWGIVVIIYTFFADERSQESKTTLYASGANCFLVGILLIIETQVLQILSGRPELYSALKYVIVLILCYPVALKIDSATKAPHKHFSKTVGVIVIVLIIVESLCSFLFDASYYRLFNISLVIMAFNTVATVYYMIKDINYIKKNPQIPSSIHFFVAMVALFTVAYIDFFHYFKSNKHITDWGRMIRISYLIFITYMIVRLFQRAIGRNKKALLAEQYKLEARTDAMTGLRNKAAFLEKELSLSDELYHSQRNGEAVSKFAIVSLDLNNLKQINDTAGHAMGDKLIINAANHIKVAVGRYGEVYRVGGDEFVALIFGDNPEQLCQHIIEKLNYNIKEYNDENTDGVMLSIAYGYSICASGDPGSINAAEREADRKMYDCKRAMKGERS